MSTDKRGRETSSKSTASSSRETAPETTSAGATTQQQPQTQQQQEEQQEQQPPTQPRSESQPLHPVTSRSSATISTATQEGDPSQHTSQPIPSQRTASFPPEESPSSSSPHVSEEQKPPAALASQPAEGLAVLATEEAERPRQVIAVSASKGPAAFFNLARKFLVTDETCDLSALEGAIVSAVDAAHLLERSQLARIIRIQTSYVTVEPKRRKQPPSTSGVVSTGSEERPPLGAAVGGEYPAAAMAPAGTQYGIPPAATMQPSYRPGQQQQQQPLHPPPRPGVAGRGTQAPGGRELRRARIVITVQRTESYKQWLAENPLQALIAGDGDDDDDDAEAAAGGADDEEEEEEAQQAASPAERRQQQQHRRRRKPS